MAYLYFKSLTQKSQFNWKDYSTFIPSLIMGTSSLLLYLSMGDENATNYTRLLLTHQPLPPEYKTTLYTLHFLINEEFYSGILMLQVPAVLIYAIISLIRYHKKLRELYSMLEDKSIHLNYAVLTWFMFSLIPAVIFVFTELLFWEKHPFWTMLFFISCTIIYFGLCYHSSQINYTVENLEQDLKHADSENTENNDILSDTDENTDNTNENTQSGKYTKLLIAFNKLIEEDEVFLQSSLRSDELARMMRTNRTYVSRLFKEEFHCTFSDYINNKRIEFAKKLMLANPDMKQDLVAEKSGFLSASSFSKVFKQTTKMTPKEWSKKEGLSL